MTFSGDHLEEKTHWSKIRSRITISAITLFLIFLVIMPTSRGYALMAIALMFTIMMHEFGHFIAAKKTKMKATEFFIGFGPRIWSFKKGETEYGIKAIPLGGYVKIIGMTSIDEIDEEDEHRTYRARHTWKKLIVIMAGVTVNLILAYVLIFSSLVFRGVPESAIDSKVKIELASPNSPADKAGIKPDDQIIKIDNKKIATFGDLVKYLDTKKIGDKVSLIVLRDSKTISKNVTLEAALDINGKKTQRAILGISQASSYKKVNPISALSQSGKSMYRVTDTSIGALGKTFSFSGLKKYSNTVVKGDYEQQDRPSSIVGIVDTGGSLVNQDIWYLVYIMSIVNIFLALFNVLPLLPLDGGHAAVAIYEGIGSKIKGRPVVANFKKLIPIATIVIGAFAVLALSSIWLDILQATS